MLTIVVTLTSTPNAQPPPPDDQTQNHPPANDLDDAANPTRQLVVNHSDIVASQRTISNAQTDVGRRPQRTMAALQRYNTRGCRRRPYRDLDLRAVVGFKARGLDAQHDNSYNELRVSDYLSYLRY